MLVFFSLSTVDCGEWGGGGDSASFYLYSIFMF